MNFDALRRFHPAILRPVWVFAATFAAALPVLACGPFLPNSILQGGDGALLRAYYSNFRFELDRIKVPPAEFKAVLARNGHASETFDSELADLRDALARSGLSSSSGGVIFEEFQAVRERLRAHAEARDEWQHRAAFYRSEDSAPAKPVLAAVGIPAGLPGEFADYLAGSVAFFADEIGSARAAWERLLARPEAERPCRSTWAAFMLGKTWLDSDPAKAIDCFRQTRALAKAGFKDALGLAAASYGWEAKAELARGRVGNAIRLYLLQDQTGDPTALASLRMVMRRIFTPPREGLMSLARDPLTQQAVTACLVSVRSFSYLDSPEDTNLVIEQWLEAVEQAGIETVASADLMALAAYQRGLFEVAERWLARADPGLAMVQWLKAKLLLRAGKVDEAAKLLAQVVRLFPKEGEAVPPILNEEWNADSPLRSAMGELGVLRLARRQYYEALDILLHSGYWIDAAYIAEFVLTADELAAYVERQWPEPEGEPAEPHADSEFSDYGRFDQQGELRPKETRPRLRYLTARRLARLERWDEAMDFYPARWKPRLTAFLAALDRGRDPASSAEVRAQALWDAAQIARHEGMELFGTEVEPDWTLVGGQYELGAVSELRLALPIEEVSPKWSNPRAWGVQMKLVSSTPDEKRRIRSHEPSPNFRFHYRYLASDLAWEAVRLMPDNTEETARVLWTAGTWLKNRDPQAADRFYKALVRRCGQTPLGQEADRLRWFPKTPDVQLAEELPEAEVAPEVVSEPLE